MNALTLQWHDAGQYKTQKIYENSPSKNPGSVRIGRDPLRCDIVLSEPTVSGLHVEIFFHPQQQSFLIRNLREQNPPLVNGQQLVKGELLLSEGSIIYLGRMELKVIAVSVPASSSVPATILSLPQPTIPPIQSPPIHQGHYQVSPTPPARPQPAYHQPLTPSPVQPQGVYGLECPRCHKVSPYEHQHLPCRWCGTSLAAAVSVLVSPGS